MAAHYAPPLFVLSFRQRDELARLAAASGWQVLGARRADGVEQRFLTSGAAVAVIDARGALDEGLAVAARLGGLIAAGGGALLVLVSRGDAGAIEQFYDRGATHFLASPASESELIQALRFAARHADRMAGEWRAARLDEPLGWRWHPGQSHVCLTPALALRLGTGERVSRRALIARMDRGDRPRALAVLRRLDTVGATAFAQDIPAFGRIVQHIQRDADTGRVDALIEPLGIAPDASARMHDAWDGARGVAATRDWIEERLADPQAPVAAVLIALTRFDIVNAAYGRPVGDALLRAGLRRIGQVARDLLGGDAAVTRIGGSEFLLATAAGDERTILAVARLERSLSRPFAVGGTVAVLGSRIGVAASVEGDDAAALLRRASEALSEAKASDSATVHGTVARGVPPIDALAVDLHRAIERGEIEMVFQPQVAIATGRIVGVEALARWEHPLLGALGADTLFAAAERADLGVVLSDHVQHLALAQAAAWPDSLSDLRLSLNLTAVDLARADFADTFLARVTESGFPAARLTVEITETGLIADLTAAAALLSALRVAGCRVAIDDFGTGYSSLAYLKALPLDYLKIDKALSQDIAGSDRDQVVVRGVIGMAKLLGLSVIAEGVETTEQRDLLAREGCDIYQGFLCAEAVDVAALVRLVGTPIR